MPTNPHAVDLDDAGEFVAGLESAKDFPELVGEDEGGPIVTMEVAAQTKSRVSVRAVHEYRNRHQNVAQRHLAVGEDRPGGERKLMCALLALEDAPPGVFVNAQAPTLWTSGLAICLRETDRPKAGVSLVVRHPGDFHEAQRLGFGGKEKVLRQSRSRALASQTVL